jgi:hypothetical protein
VVSGVGVQFVADGRRTIWFEGAARWNRRVSIAVALAAGLATFLVGWAMAIKFGSWFGVFLGWWPALFMASIVALVAGRAWPALPLVAVLVVLAGDRGAGLASSALAADAVAPANASVSIIPRANTPVSTFTEWRPAGIVLAGWEN